ncbi:hypothetical protein [Actinoplanes regularis]|uniref:hypothetical protein n=1 Tax=Actinoplanes regularis TaxID=52697 RepID=UPI0024A5ACE7|nr:hypothetical protein [Actinoplanes regularis]GLW27326.1 hypothetical protein Areg01_02670 [Actinoplanes regularis]
MPSAHRHVPRPRRPHGAVPAVAAAAAVMALTVPAAPASAGSAACTVGGFTATTHADLARINLLDLGPLASGLPSLADVRLAPTKSEVAVGRTTATASYADAKLLGMNLPGLPLQGTVATSRAPGHQAGPVDVTLAALNAGGLVNAQLGKASAQATWNDKYRCGKTGPLTRASTMIEGLNVLGATDTGPAAQGLGALTGLTNLTSLTSHGGHSGPGGRTSLLKVGPTGATQTATDLVKLRDGRVGVRSGARITLGELTLFAGTPQEIAVKVITQPTLEVLAGGDRKNSTVNYRPAVLSVTSAGKPVAGLDSDNTSLSLDLPSGTTAQDGQASQMTVRLSLGRADQKITASAVSAEASALRVEVRHESESVLDMAFGYLSVAATGPCLVSAQVPIARVPSAPAVDKPVSRPEPKQTTKAPAAASGTSGVTSLAKTGANVAAVGIGGVALIVGGLVALFLTRRRHPAEN